MRSVIQWAWICLPRDRRRWFAALGLTLLGAAGAAAYLARDIILDDPLPPLSIDRHLHDFGSIRQAEAVTTAFRLTNNTQAPIRLVDVLKSCDCTFVDVPRRSLQPQASIRIEVTWDTGIARASTRRRVMAVYTIGHDRRLYGLEFTLAANIEPDFTYTPLELPTDISTKAEGCTIVLAPAAQQDFKVTEAYATVDGWSVMIEQPASPNNEWRVLLKSTSSAFDLTQGDLVIVTNSPREKTVKIPLGRTGD